MLYTYILIHPEKLLRCKVAREGLEGEAFGYRSHKRDIHQRIT